jgi:hypothetical protein
MGNISRKIEKESEKEMIMTTTVKYKVTWRECFKFNRLESDIACIEMQADQYVVKAHIEYFAEEDSKPEIWIEPQHKNNVWLQSAIKDIIVDEAKYNIGYPYEGYF